MTSKKRYCSIKYCIDMSGTSHFWSRSRREIVLGLGPGPVQKQILVPVPVKNILVTVPVQKNILVLVLFRKYFGASPGPAGTTLPISNTTTFIMY